MFYFIFDESGLWQTSGEGANNRPYSGIDRGSWVAQWWLYCFSPSSHGFDSGLPKIVFFNVADIYQWRWLEESGQSHENVD